MANFKISPLNLVKLKIFHIHDFDSFALISQLKMLLPFLNSTQSFLEITSNFKQLPSHTHKKKVSEVVEVLKTISVTPATNAIAKHVFAQYCRTTN